MCLIMGPAWTSENMGFFFVLGRIWVYDQRYNKLEYTNIDK